MEKQVVGILLTLIGSLIAILLSESLKISTLITGIIVIAIFIALLIFLFSYYLRYINIEIEKNKLRIDEVNKDLNIEKRLIKIEKDVEWLKK